MDLNTVNNNLTWLDIYEDYTAEVQFSSSGSRLLVFKNPYNKDRVYSINSLAKECFQVLSGLKNHTQTLVARDIYLKLCNHNRQLNNKLSNESFIVRIFVWVRDFFSYQNILNKRKPLLTYYNMAGNPTRVSFA
ncbi:MAG: hypothetical protein PVI40_02235 [Chlamydiota bacterium]|jgi:hypothetical protein